MRTALVSGNAGFIGRHFTRYLEREGWIVTGFDVARGIDARNYFFDHSDRFDLLVHAAANVGGRKAIDQSPLWVAENLAIDQCMFEWAVRTRTPVLYFSSSAAYPTHLQEGEDWRPLEESDICLERLDGTPDSTYGWSKLTGEILAAVARRNGARVSVVRPMSGYGEDQSADYPFGSFLDKAFERHHPFQIWSDGTQLRDWIHVDDAVRACMAVVESGTQDPVNLATGRGTSFTELAHMFMESSGHRREVEYVLDAPRGCSFRVGDSSLMRSLYTPMISVEEGVARAVQMRRSE